MGKARGTFGSTESKKGGSRKRGMGKGHGDGKEGRPKRNEEMRDLNVMKTLFTSSTT
jgi:hypothetical protein